MRFVASYQDSETTRRRAAKGETIIAATREGIIGTVTLATVQSTHGSPFYDRADVASVGQFGVAPPHKGRGIGSSLMDLVEERARELGVAYLALDTSEHAHGLMELYGRRGYRFIEHVQWQDVNYRSVVMAKTLAAPQA